VVKKVELKKIPKPKLDEARKTVARLKEKFKTGISARPSQGPTDTAYQDFVSKLEEEDLETGLQGTAELGDLESGRKS
jgi:hypothetical protein